MQEFGALPRLKELHQSVGSILVESHARVSDMDATYEGQIDPLTGVDAMTGDGVSGWSIELSHCAYGGTT